MAVPAPLARRLALAFALLAVAACSEDKKMYVAPDADPGAPDAGPAAYLEPCVLQPDNCDAPEMCFMFNNKGPHCTHTCSVATDCAAPSPGCSGMGVCKVP
jgi:hypothetical protein